MRSLTHPTWGVLCCLALAALIGSSTAQAEDFEELLQEVGQQYAESYAAPFVHTFGPNLTSNLFSTASIPWHGLTFGIGFKVTGAAINDDDKSFRKVIEDVQFADFLPAGHPYAGNSGDIVMEGPTVFGDTETDGTLSFYSGGLLLGRETAIPGLVDTDYAPMIVPELYVGGLFGLKGTVRYLPEVDLGDYGKTTFKGLGLQWSARGLLPELPVDLMAGFFTQQLDIGDLLETKAHSFFLGASKDFALVTVYTGVAKESSEMTITYEFEDLSEDVSFTVDGVQDKRAILGATLGLPLVTLNAEVAKGSIATYSAGLMFGI